MRVQRYAEVWTIGLVDVREAVRSQLGTLFLVAALVSGYLLILSIRSTRIDGVETGILSLVYLLPTLYWVGLAFLFASTVIWYFGGVTRPYHFLLVALWTGYLFVGPELMEANPRGVSSYAQFWGVEHILAGREKDFFYFPWLGFHAAFAELATITDLGHLAMMRIGLLVMYAGLAAGLVTLFGRVLPDSRSVLFATLVALCMAAVLGVGLTPHQMSFSLMLFAFAFLFTLDAKPVVNRIALFTVFGAILVTHGLTTIVAVYVAAASALVLWKRAHNRTWSPAMLSLSLIFAASFAAWLMYSSDFWFPTAITSFRDTVLREPLAFVSPFSHVSPGREGVGRADVSLLNFGFLAVLLVWLVSFAATRRFWRGLSRERLFPLLVVAGMPLLVMGSGNFSFEAFLRVFLYAIPFLAWFLARESRARGTAIAFLFVMAGLGFAILYAREFEELPTSQEFAGAGFIVGTAAPGDAVIQGECLPLGAIMHTLDAPYTACLGREPDQPVPGAYGLEDQFAFVVLSEFGERSADFAYGELPFEYLDDAVQVPAFSRIYSNGDYDIYANALFTGHK